LAPAADGRGWKYFAALKFCPEKFRTENSAVVAFDEAAVGLAGKKELPDAKNDQRKDAAKQHGENHRCTQGNEGFFEKCIHGILSYAR
jgi:hypothetical protein